MLSESRGISSEIMSFWDKQVNNQYLYLWIRTVSWGQRKWYHYLGCSHWSTGDSHTHQQLASEPLQLEGVDVQRVVKHVCSWGQLWSLNNPDHQGSDTGLLPTRCVTFGQVSQPLCLSLLTCENVLTSELLWGLWVNGTVVTLTTVSRRKEALRRWWTLLLRCYSKGLFWGHC